MLSFDPCYFRHVQYIMQTTHWVHDRTAEIVFLLIQVFYIISKILRKVNCLRGGDEVNELSVDMKKIVPKEK